MPRVLVVGQTPPPFHGQAIMIEYLVNGKFENLEIEHIRLDFSEGIADVGTFSLRKIARLFKTVAKIYRAACFHKIDYLYYPPAGPNKIPMLRDIAILISCRWLFKRTIFHFHAGGISTLYERLSPLLKYFYRLAYFKPDLSIIVSVLNPRDDQFFQSLRMVEIPYGIPDHAHQQIVHKNARMRILYLSSVFKKKGILELLSAACLLRDAGHDFQIDVVGAFESKYFEEECHSFLEKARLKDIVFFQGEKIGDEKWEYYKSTDIFCFPTYHESETFGIVLLEAMQFSLPSVATRWRGAQSIVEEGQTGFLVAPRSPDELADKLAALLTNESLRTHMGQRARARYELNYGLQGWLEKIELSIMSLETETK